MRLFSIAFCCVIIDVLLDWCCILLCWKKY